MRELEPYQPYDPSEMVIRESRPLVTRGRMATLVVVGGALMYGFGVGGGVMSPLFDTPIASVPDTVPDTPTATFDFETDWGDATGGAGSGAGLDALLDDAGTYSWTRLQTTYTNRLAVVDAATANSDGCQGWPAVTNVLDISYNGTDSDMLQVEGGWSVPTGSYLYKAYFICIAAAVGDQWSGHYDHLGENTGGNDYLIWSGTPTSNAVAADSTMDLWHYEGVGTLSSYDVYAMLDQLRTHTVYLFELRAERVTSTTARFNIRISDKDGTLLFSGADFLGNYGAGPATDSVGSDTGTYSGSVGWTGAELGNNGNINQSAGTHTYIAAYRIRVSVSGDNWIGTTLAGGS